MSVSHRQSLPSYFDRAQWFVYFLVLLLGILLRWSQLADKPMHHDEILHAAISNGFFKDPVQSYYKYDPMLHGPVLYYALRASFSLLGVSEFSARLPVALLGSFFLVVPLLFRKYFSPLACISLTTAISFSPILTFFSRFIIHDYFIICATILMLIGICLAPDRWKALLAVPAIALQLCVKQNVFMTIAIIAAYLLFEHLVLRIYHQSERSLLSRLLIHVTRFLPHLAISVVIGILFFYFFYSAGFQDSHGIINSPFTAGFKYWLGQHGNERLGGHFVYPLYVFLLYELPLVLFLSAHAVCLFIQGNRFTRFLETLGLALGCVLFALYSNLPASNLHYLELLKLKTPFDALFSIFLIFHALAITLHHLQRKENVLAATGYFFTATLWSYCFVGEKVPWLTEYPLITGMVYLTLFFDTWFTQHPIPNWRNYPLWKLGTIAGLAGTGLGFILVACSGFSAHYSWVIYPSVTLLAFCVLSRLLPGLKVNVLLLLASIISIAQLSASLITNFIRNGEPSELIVQVHTSRELVSTFDEIKTALNNVPPDAQARVLALSGSTWPAYWYLRNYPLNWTTVADHSPYLFILDDGPDCKRDLQDAGFTCSPVDLYCWWFPNYDEIDLAEFFQYYFTHKPFGNEPACTYLSFYKRNK